MTKKDILKKKNGEIIHEAKIDEKIKINNINPILFGLILFAVVVLIILLF